MAEWLRRGLQILMRPAENGHSSQLPPFVPIKESQGVIGMTANFPAIDYDDGYPEDEEFTAWHDVPLSFKLAAEWLLRELPRAAENMLCFCDAEDGVDIIGKPCTFIKFSTGGWSGAESVIALIERRPDLSYFMQSWRRGGHYVFEVPA